MCGGTLGRWLDIMYGSQQHVTEAYHGLQQHGMQVGSVKGRGPFRSQPSLPPPPSLLLLKVCCLSAAVSVVLQVTIPSRVAREAVNAEELRLQVNAAFIAGLPQVGPPVLHAQALLCRRSQAPVLVLASLFVVRAAPGGCAPPDKLLVLHHMPTPALLLL